MKRLAHFNIGILIALAATFYVTYYLLIKDNFLHASIADIITNSHRLHNQRHLLVLGLLPVYIGAIVFGSAMLGIYAGSLIQRRIFRRNKPKILSLPNNTSKI